MEDEIITIYLSQVGVIFRGMHVSMKNRRNIRFSLDLTTRPPVQESRETTSREKIHCCKGGGSPPALYPILSKRSQDNSRLLCSFAGEQWLTERIRHTSHPHTSLLYSDEDYKMPKSLCLLLGNAIKRLTIFPKEPIFY